MIKYFQLIENKLFKQKKAVLVSELLLKLGVERRADVDGFY